jgi:hypothetical protein
MERRRLEGGLGGEFTRKRARIEVFGVRSIPRSNGSVLTGQPPWEITS